MADIYNVKTILGTFRVESKPTLSEMFIKDGKQFLAHIDLDNKVFYLASKIVEERCWLTDMMMVSSFAKHGLNQICECFSKETCYPGCVDDWSEKNKTAGHCAIAALVINDLLGGEIHKTQMRGISHYYNVVKFINDGNLPARFENQIIDITADQFGHFSNWIPYKEGDKVSREYILSNSDTAKRYEILKSKVEEWIKTANHKEWCKVC